MSKKLQVRWTMFGDMAKGGYMRTFESVSHPGITGMVSRKTRQQPKEDRIFVFEDQEYWTAELAIEAWEKKNLK